NTPGILRVEGVFIGIRSGERPIRTGAGERLGEAERPVRGEVGITVEGVGSAEVAREEVIDVLEIHVQPGLEGVAAMHVRQAVRPLYGSGIGVTGAEVVEA